MENSLVQQSGSGSILIRWKLFPKWLTVLIPTRDKGLHCKGRACIFLHWSTLLPRGWEQATDPRAVAVVSLGPSSPHPQHTHPHKQRLLHHKGRHARPPPLSYVRKCHAADHPHCGLSPISWINLQYDNPHMGHSDVFRSMYMTKLKSVKPPEIPGMGVSVDRKIKGERKK